MRQPKLAKLQIEFSNLNWENNLNTISFTRKLNFFFLLYFLFKSTNQEDEYLNEHIRQSRFSWNFFSSWFVSILMRKCPVVMYWVRSSFGFSNYFGENTKHRQHKITIEKFRLRMKAFNGKVSCVIYMKVTTFLRTYKLYILRWQIEFSLILLDNILHK